MRKIFLIFLLLILGCEDKKIDENPCKVLNETLKYDNVKFELALTGTEFQDAPHGFIKIINNNQCAVSISEKTNRSTINSSHPFPNHEYQRLIENSTTNGTSIIVIPSGCVAYILHPNDVDENGNSTYDKYGFSLAINYFDIFRYASGLIPDSENICYTNVGTGVPHKFEYSQRTLNLLINI